MARGWDWLIISSMVMVIGSVGVTAENELHIQISEINVYNFPQLMCRILVMDENWIPMSGLTLEHVEIFEDDVQQQFGMTEDVDPAALGITLDYSGSMLEQPLADLEAAALLFIDLMQPDEEASIIKFSSIAEIVQTRTSDKQALKAAVTNYWPPTGGSTALFDSIVLGVNQNLGAKDRGVVLAFTDGGENNSYATLEETYNYCITNRNVIYTLGFAGFGLDEYILRALANFTGGEYYFAPDSDLMIYLYAYISALLHLGYQIDYTTSNPVMDGSIRKVDVKVRVGDRTGWATKYYRASTVPAVGLTDFVAQSGVGLTYLRWRTETETDNAGFNIWRAKQEQGPYEKVNSAMIWGHGTTTQEHYYSYFDHSAKAGHTYYYKLEDVEYDGDYSFSQPISAASVPGTANLLLAGWLTPRLSSVDGGTLVIAALAADRDCTVELYYENLPTGVLLNDAGIDGDVAANDGVFGLSLYLPPGVAPPGEYLLELVSTSKQGVINGRWPHLCWMDAPFVAPESSFHAVPSGEEHPAAAPPAKPLQLGIFTSEPIFGPSRVSALLSPDLAQAAVRFATATRAFSLPQSGCSNDILAGGYWFTAFTANCGGRITPLLVTASDVGASTCVDVSVNGVHCDLEFQDNGSSADLQAQDQVYGAVIDHYQYVPPQALVLEYQLQRDDASEGNHYPYLLVY